VSLFLAARAFRRGERARAQKPLLGAMLLGAGFVGLQGREWLALLAQGLTITSSTLGSFFYLIIGLHALHAVAAIAIVATAWLRLRRGFLAPGLLAAAEVFWYFVVGVWPVLYWRVYLS
jgi:cytochrome c oxidase subunit 3